MPHWHPTSCRRCGRGEAEVGRISQTGQCFDCAVNRNVQNLAQLMAGTGPFHDHWRQRLAEAVASPDTDQR